MSAAKRHTVLHEFDTRVDDETGAEKKFHPGAVYDGPDKLIPMLLKGVDFRGPLIAAEKSPAAPKEK